MRVALIGAGRIGKVHAASIKMDPRSTLVAVSDVVTEAATALASDHDIAVRTTDEIFADRSIDAVLIASSTDTHADLIAAGIQANKAIFCEKPIDLSIDRARQIQQVAEGYGNAIMIGFNRRFDPNFSALKRSLDSGEIGNGELLSVTSYDPAPPPISYIKVSGGLFRDMMIHDFDMCCYLFGMPSTVMAHGACLVDETIGAAGDIDTAVVVLTYADGRMATIRNSRRASYGYDQRVEVLGSEGLLAADNEIENTLQKASATGVTKAKPVYFFLERYMRAYAVEWQAFVAAVLDGRPASPTLQDGVNALVLANAANLSLQEARPVKIDPQQT